MSNLDEYDPLPLTSNEHPTDALYNAPSSPDPPSADLTEFNFNDSPRDSFHSAVPVGAAQPRFVGPALYQEVGAPYPRNSFLSSHSIIPSSHNSEHNSSVYALNDLTDTRNSSNVYEEGYRDDPGHDFFVGERAGVPMTSVGKSRYLEEKLEVYGAPRSKSRRKIFLWLIVAGILIIILAIVIALYFAVIKPKKSGGTRGALVDGSSSSAAKPQSTSTPSVKTAISGGDGSTVTMDDGSTFVYSNSFGGTWYWDESNPFNNNAQAQSWSPPLNQTFKYGSDKIWG
jgi:glucan 1,3-beta-glucosidase